MTTLLILGGTGLVGQQLIEAAINDPTVALVTAPARRTLPPHPKLCNPLISFDELPETAPWWKADAVLCALGTTLRLAGSREGFRKVDYDYVLAAAALARKAGTEVFVLNSSVGADTHSGSFYLRVKGEAEQALAALGFSSITLVRPSILDGGPRPDKRPGEAIGLWFARRFSAIIPAHYRAVSTTAVAACMLAAAKTAPQGRHIIESENIQRILAKP